MSQLFPITILDCIPFAESPYSSVVIPPHCSLPDSGVHSQDVSTDRRKLRAHHPALGGGSPEGHPGRLAALAYIYI